MHTKRTPELEEAYICALRGACSDTDAALECGIAPFAIVDWLEDGIGEYATDEQRSFTIKVAKEVAARRRKMFEDVEAYLGEPDKSNASAAGKAYDLAMLFVADQKFTGLLGQAIANARGQSEDDENLKTMLLTKNEGLYRLIESCGLEVVPLGVNQ